MLYLFIKSLHLIFVIALMGGLLLYPRYKLHQMKSQPGEDLFETMKSASNRLRRIILNPALILVWVLGITMLVMNTSLLTMGWIHAKLAFVLALSGLHGYYISMGKKIDKGDANISAGTLKRLNEVPFALMIVIVLLVIMKPF